MFRSFLILLVLGSLICTPGTAQETQTPEPAAAPTETDTAQPLSTASLAKRADEAASALLNIQESLESSAGGTSDIPAKVDALQADLDERLLALRPGKIDELQPTEAEALLQTLNRMRNQLLSWRDKLQQRSDQLDQHRREVKLEQDYFASILSDDESQDFPSALVDRLNSVIANLQTGRDFVDERLDAKLAELTRISALMLRIREASQLISTNQQQDSRKATRFDGPPIWQLERSERAWRDRVPYEFRTRLDGVTEFIRANESHVIMVALMFVVIVVLVVLARRSIIRQSEETDIDLARRPFIERPISLAFLLWVIVAPQISLPALPLALGAVRLAIALVALLRLLPLIVTQMERKSLTVLLSLAMLSSVLEILPRGDIIDRAVMMFISLIGCFFFVKLGRTLKDTPYSGRGLWWLLGRILTSVAPLLLGISFVALIVGAVSFAHQTIRGVLSMLVVLLALVIVESALVTASQFLVAGPGQRWLRSIRRYPDLTRRRLAFFIRVAMLLILVSILPRVFPLLDLLFDWVAKFLSTDMSIGTVAVSIQGILTLVFSVIIAIYVARFIRFTLDEDVFPRMPIATGAAAAASRLIYYALITGGILFALAAGGVELTKLTLLISALGVGIGFGLQGIVNNFVSGLVLAFERPFQVGDIIAVGTLTGRVRQIGLRASRVRTFDGAEVIVPNADLVAGHVINWTLSDRMRRLDIKVGVAYGTDPGEVRAILLKVAEENEVVAKNPESAALFDGFGDSSLDFTLRAWIPEAGDWPQITSDLNEAVNAALQEAGIEIPFPQRTLHIRSDKRDSGAV